MSIVGQLPTFDRDSNYRRRTLSGRLEPSPRPVETDYHGPCWISLLSSDGGGDNCLSRPGVLGGAPAKMYKNALALPVGKEVEHKIKNNSLATTYFRRRKPTIMGPTGFHF